MRILTLGEHEFTVLVLWFHPSQPGQGSNLALRYGRAVRSAGRSATAAAII